MKNESYYILVNSDGFNDFDKRVDANLIADFRIKNKAYPMNKGTFFKDRIKNNDNFIFYIAGQSKHKHSIYAYGKIGKTLPSGSYDEEDIHIGNPISKTVQLKSCQKFKNIRLLKEIKEDLAFIKDKRFWGRYLQGGVTQLSQKDFEIILAHAQN
ncbi:EVE domain-containing protein [Gammaproteobacteria bacterium]|nr:EVE domain-containing protein [Gammaproteobacteria bacterium]